ncbi:cytochrome c [Cocleimonas sp. KMM 6892]|uniref:cytochrome c n=1 Tax=unclassified Cocleimonas TaxID=2639732 RepID=UPI002DBFE1E8|nr:MULTISPECIES: cytochrome c [unclassified Cocleimonas]MEB8432750.1 cytochrome c [Cocleimonas sp. KMM 6892]MEC4715609.1 cytochrome c [Cocleimonas sp. KMM 6895]MEC4744773.1 cytochrome c [Cocleimonas sp. KMM 6896]
MKLILFISLALSLFLAACDNDKQTGSKSSKKVEGRWYTTAQSLHGKQVFKDNCATCHGNEGQGLAEDWRKPMANDTYPAPPLNGTAHTWHHSTETLLRTINYGGVPLGGTMPAFKDKLSENEKEAVLAHVMSFWSDDIYSAWKKRNP